MPPLPPQKRHLRLARRFKNASAKRKRIAGAYGTDGADEEANSNFYDLQGKNRLPLDFLILAVLHMCDF
jgi:hypothetical protein